MIDRDDTPDSTDDPFEDEIFEEEDDLVIKGVRPLLDGEMINFLYWLKRVHPEIGRIRDVSKQGWRQIAQERGVPFDVLNRSISVLKDQSFHGEGYDKVRAEQKRLGL